MLAGAPPFEGSGIEADGCRVFPIEFFSVLAGTRSELCA
jgi:hypothetical protein